MQLGGRGGESEPAVGQNYDVRCQQQPFRITQKTLPVTYVTIVRPRFVTLPAFHHLLRFDRSSHRLLMISAVSPPHGLSHDCPSHHKIHRQEYVTTNFTSTSLQRPQFAPYLPQSFFPVGNNAVPKPFSVEGTHDI